MGGQSSVSAQKPLGMVNLEFWPPPSPSPLPAPSPSPLPAPSPLQAPSSLQDDPVNFVFVLDYCLHPSAQADPGDQTYWPIDKQLFKANILNFNYRIEPPPNVKDLLDSNKLQDHASRLLEFESQGDTEQRAPRLILIGYGYGGLICEHAALLAKSEPDNKALAQVDGVVLFNTPHFQTGLKQWATMCAAKEKRGNWDTAADEEVKKIINTLVKKQEDFCKVCADPDTSVKVLCCFTDPPEPLSDLKESLSAEWCILPGFSAAHIRSTYTKLTLFAKGTDTEYSDVKKQIAKWARQSREKNPAADANAGSSKLWERLQRVLKESDSMRGGKQKSRRL